MDMYLQSTMKAAEQALKHLDKMRKEKIAADTKDMDKDGTNA